VSTPNPDVVVFHAAELSGVDRGLGITSYELAGAESGASHLLTGMTVIPAGTAIPWHTHDQEESIVILEGAASCETTTEAYSLGQFDATLIQPGVLHRFANVAPTILRILWIYPDLRTTRTLRGAREPVGHLEPYPSRDA
jgi:quercetin dioxygenase-like cupin family protein